MNSEKTQGFHQRRIVEEVAAVWYGVPSSQCRRVTPERLEEEVISSVAEWLGSKRNNADTVRSVRRLDGMCKLLADWLKPRTKQGRTRVAPKAMRLHLVLMPCALLLSTQHGKKRPLDLVWTRFLPKDLMTQLLLGPGRGGGAREFLQFIREVAGGEIAKEQVNYAIISRRHAKWYVGVFHAKRKRNQLSVPGAHMRYAEHLEGMNSPAKAKGSGVKYHMWAKRPVGHQLLTPLAADTKVRSDLLEAYQLAVFSPPANVRGVKMNYEDMTWEKMEKRAVANRAPPRWRRKALSVEEALMFNFWDDHEQQRRCYEWKLVRRSTKDLPKVDAIPLEQWHRETPGETYLRHIRRLAPIGESDPPPGLWYPGGFHGRPVVFGPVNMYDEKHSEVYLQHLGTPKISATSSHLYKLSTVYLHQLVLDAQKLPKTAKRTTILAKLGYLLRIRGVRSIGAQHVRVPRVGHLGANSIRSAIIRGIRQCPVEDTRQEFWIQGLHVHEQAEPSFHRHARDHRIVAREFDLNKWEALPEFEKWRAQRSEPIDVLAESLDTPASVDPKHISRMVRRELFSWFYSVGMPRVAKRSIALQVQREVWATTPRHFNRLTQCYVRQFGVTEDETLVGLDRNIRAAARMKRTTYCAGLYNTYVADRTHYRIIPPEAEQEELKKMTRNVNAALPRFIRRRPMTIGREYLNLKEKCCSRDASGIMRLTCQREHSHWREVSVQNNPYRSEVQSAARAVDYLNRADPQKSYSSEGLHMARKEIQQAYDALNKDARYVCRCRRCGKAKDPLSLLRGDGTQMFKEVEHAEVLRGFRETAGRVSRAYGMSAVFEDRAAPKAKGPRLAKTVFFSKKCRVWTFGHSKSAPVPHPWKIRGENGRSLEGMLRGTGAMTLSRLGRHLLQRLRGVEMGGSASPTKANLVFSTHERRRRRRRGRLLREKFIMQDEHLDSVIGGVRYADDLLLLSTLLCTHCLEEYGRSLYAPPIEFEVEERGPVVTFCDLVVWGRHDSIEMWRHDPNVDFTLGLVSVPRKIRYPPFLAPGLVPRRKLRAWLSGSWHTEAQRTDDRGRFLAGVLRPVAELLIKGFPIHTLKRAAADIQSPAIKDARDYATKWMRALKCRYGDLLDRDTIHQEIFDIHKITGALRHRALA